MKVFVLNSVIFDSTKEALIRPSDERNIVGVESSATLGRWPTGLGIRKVENENTKASRDPTLR